MFLVVLFFYAVNKRYVFLDVLNGRIGVITKKKKNARTSYRADAFHPLSPLPLNSFIAKTVEIKRILRGCQCGVTSQFQMYKEPQTSGSTSTVRKTRPFVPTSDDTPRVASIIVSIKRPIPTRCGRGIRSIEMIKLASKR